MIETIAVVETEFGFSDFEEICNRVADAEAYAINSLTIIICGHEKISELNLAYLERDYATDVLAFDLRPEEDSNLNEIDGEIYLDVETARERAPEFETTTEKELQRYLIHGLLHLCGYTDKEESGKSLMSSKEETYLS